MDKRASEYHKYDAPLCCLTDTMHSEDEDITLKLPSLLPSTSPSRLNYCLDYDFNAFSATNEAIGNMHHYLRRIRLWWRQANQLRSYFISHMNKYQNALSYHSIDSLPWDQRENYMVACYADCKYQLGGKLCPLPRTDKEKTVSQERFYRAIMGRALDTKALQFLAFFEECEESEVTGRMYDQIINLWSENSDRTLQERFEMLEIFDYTSNFLLLNVFSSPAEHLDWADHTRKSDIVDGSETFFDNWMSFHIRLQSFLTPFDILSLFKENHKMEGEVSLYLLNFVLPNGVDSHGPVPGMREVENTVSRKLSEPLSGAWKAYRRHHWRSAIRGRVFSDVLDASDYRVQCKEDNWLWWEKLERVESLPLDASLSILVPRLWFVPLADLTQPGEEEPDLLSSGYFYVVYHTLGAYSRT